MSPEGKLKVNDLRPVKAKRIKPRYKLSQYGLVIKGQSKKKLRLLVLLSAVLVIAFFITQSDSFAALRLLLSIRNQKILLGFQNSAELRPTGGFWGSFGIWQINNNVTSSTLFFETNPYKKDNPLLKKTNEPLPKPLAETYKDRPQSFVNANWQSDFKEAAKSLEWFLAQGWEEKVDGTIAVSSLAIIDLLKETGPIKFDDFEINSDNFTELMSQKIDTEYWQSEENKEINEPKTILKDLAPLLIDESKKLGVLKLSKFIKAQVKQGRILAYFSNDRKQSYAKKLGISGEIQPSQIDYLHINNANINGGKSSLNVNQSVTYSVQTGQNNPVASLSIRRTMNDGWPNILNRNYLRVFSPLGSELISAKLGSVDIKNSVDISQENGLTCFGTWFSVAPNSNEELVLTYKLPFPNERLKNYHLTYQKQPGTLPEKMRFYLDGGERFNSKINQLITRI